MNPVDGQHQLIWVQPDLGTPAHLTGEPNPLGADPRTFQIPGTAVNGDFGASDLLLITAAFTNGGWALDHLAAADWWNDQDAVRTDAYSTILRRDFLYGGEEQVLDTLSLELPRVILTGITLTRPTDAGLHRCTLARTGGLSTNVLEEVLEVINAVAPQLANRRNPRYIAPAPKISLLCRLLGRR